VTPPQIDHLCWLIDDPEATESALRSFGVGSEFGMYYPRAGTQHWVVPLLPPQCLEFMTIVNRSDAATGDVGPEVLAAEAAGGGLWAWAVLVDDLDATARRHGLEIDDYTLPQPDGTLRGWRTASGPTRLPFFIDYPNNGNRLERLAAVYDRVHHTSAPTGFSRLVIEGDAAEILDWIGPNDLPFEFAEGARGLVAAEIDTVEGVLRIPELAFARQGR
jgi:hypothetical protein